eukprot:gb/GEZN01019325.1/.p2 GENE.gb/GEZN01019325.1/~~gb/GEZN01019325.1/.p2  ORF type:complete len:104 (-),score=4.50 gb/GEZN01019325.1/:69-380(-)
MQLGMDGSAILKVKTNKRNSRVDKSETKQKDGNNKTNQTLSCSSQQSQFLLVLSSRIPAIRSRISAYVSMRVYMLKSSRYTWKRAFAATGQRNIATSKHRVRF